LTEKISRWFKKGSERTGPFGSFKKYQSKRYKKETEGLPELWRGAEILGNHLPYGKEPPNDGRTQCGKNWKDLERRGSEPS